MTTEEAEKWLDDQNFEYLPYTHSETKNTGFDVAGWMLDGKENRVRVHVVAPTLQDAVAQIMMKRGTNGS